MSMTINPGSVVDEGRFAVQRTIRIEASVEKVWAAVTRPEHISQWFGKAQLEGEGAGASGSLTFEGYGVIPIRVEAFDPPRSVTYRWGNDDALGQPAETVDDVRSTVFTFTLEDLDGATQLTVVESGFENTSDPVANLESHREGWDGELDKLVALLESGS